MALALFVKGIGDAFESYFFHIEIIYFSLSLYLCVVE